MDKSRISTYAVIALFFAAGLCLMAWRSGLVKDRQLQDGDIIFQASQSSQCEAIRLATGSLYTHCGIIFEHDGQWMVLEAVQPVKITPFDQWTERGIDGKYVVKRLKDAGNILTEESRTEMIAEAKTMLGREYDLWFGWSDERIYCSELVWKIYRRGAGVEIGKLQKLSEFELSHVAVQTKLRERYGNDIPLDELVISPASIFESGLLETVYSN